MDDEVKEFVKYWGDRLPSSNYEMTLKYYIKLYKYLKSRETK